MNVIDELYNSKIIDEYIIQNETPRVYEAPLRVFGESRVFTSDSMNTQPLYPDLSGLSDSNGCMLHVQGTSGF